MLHMDFASRVVSSTYTPLLADNTYKVIAQDACKVLGYIISPLFSVLPLTITIASADSSTVYKILTMSGATATNIVDVIPWIADKGLAWKSTGSGVFSVLVSSTFFLSQAGN